MGKRKPDLHEKKIKSFVTDQNGEIKFVETVDERKTYLEQRVISKSEKTSVLFRCELCGQFVPLYCELCSEKLGYQCGCLEKRVNQILSDQFWNPGSIAEAEISKAVLIKKVIKSEQATVVERIKKLFSRE